MIDVTNMELLALAATFFLTSAVSVVTVSTSLITVPLLLQFGVEPRTPLATNMFALTWIRVRETQPFLRSPGLDRKRLPTLIILTLCGSVLGALLVLLVPAPAVPLNVAATMIGVALFSTFYRNTGVYRPAEPPKHCSRILYEMEECTQ